MRFVDNRGGAEDFGASCFSDGNVHRLALFDLRTLNLDRHGGNILVDSTTGDPVPIDHGCAFPSEPGEPCEWPGCNGEWRVAPGRRRFFIVPRVIKRTAQLLFKYLSLLISLPFINIQYHPNLDSTRARKRNPPPPLGRVGRAFANLLLALQFPSTRWQMRT